MLEKKLLIVEPEHTGHHMAHYLRHQLRAFVSKGWRVALLTTPEATDSHSFRIAFENLEHEVQIFTSSLLSKGTARKPSALIIRELISWINLRKAFREVSVCFKPQIVYVPSIDWIGKIIGILGSPFGNLEFLAMYISPKHHRSQLGLGTAARSDQLYNWLFRRFLSIKTLKKVYVIDEYFYSFAVSKYKSLKGKLIYVPDFGTLDGERSREQCRRALRFSEKEKVVLVYGALNSRKGVKELLSAMLSVQGIEQPTLLLAGSPSPDIASLLENTEFLSLRQRRKLVTRFFFHDLDQEYEVFKAADFIWLGYVQNFYGSSGVLYQSVVARVPVIAMKDGIIGKIVRRYNLGFTIDSQSIADIKDALVKIQNPDLCIIDFETGLTACASVYSAQSHVRALLSGLN